MRSHLNFDPFDLRRQKERGDRRVKFERMNSQVKTRPMWWLLMVFAIVLLVYWYLTTRIA